MSKPYSQGGEKGTDTNQTSEDELRAEILTEFKQVHKLAPADYTENCTNVVMSIIRTEKLKLLAEVRERVVGEDEGLVEVTKRNLVTASHFNAVIKSRNQLRETIRKKLMEKEL